MDYGKHVEYCENGEIKREIIYSSDKWTLNGKVHRVDGPAYTEYRSDGKIKSEEWYLDGKELSPLEFENWRNIHELGLEGIF